MRPAFRTWTRFHRFALLTALALVGSLTAMAENRFPRPEFDSGHALPLTPVPAARSLGLQYLDVAVLAAALTLASMFAIRRRSRRGILLLTIFSLIYFGFWRKGCICPVGSVQNVVTGLTDSTYALPAPVLIFFALPLVFAFFFGRTFCAAVCPLGAIQDIVILRPARLPRWLNHALGMLPFVYLALAVLFAACGAGYVICRYDPFVGFYRLSAPTSMLITGGVLLVLGTVVARPYCRFLCPYGVLLKLASWTSKWHLAITPDTCVDCRLCRPSCPFDAIRWPTPPSANWSRDTETHRLARFLVIMPLVLALGAWCGWRLAPALAGYKPEVRLARHFAAQQGGNTVESTVESDGFLESGGNVSDLLAGGGAMERQFAAGGAIAGGVLAMVVMIKLMTLSARRTLTGHVPDRADCLSCGRCLDYCPVGRRRETERAEGLAHASLRTGEGRV